MIPQAIVVGTAILTLKSDTTPITVTVNKPRGTIYWGGAGLDGDYIADQLKALQEAGLKYVFEGKRSYSMPIDAVRSGTSLRYRSAPTDDDWAILGMEHNPSPQFNMIGYSYGSLLAAQTAYFYASNGHIVDHLALIGSTIEEDFLLELEKQKNIKKLIVKNLQEYGDPIFAGMSQLRLFMSLIKLKNQMAKTIETKEGVGHFYYAAATSEGGRRRRALAAWLVQQGMQ